MQLIKMDRTDVFALMLFCMLADNYCLIWCKPELQVQKRLCIKCCCCVAWKEFWRLSLKNPNFWLILSIFLLQSLSMSGLTPTEARSTAIASGPPWLWACGSSRAGSWAWCLLGPRRQRGSIAYKFMSASSRDYAIQTHFKRTLNLNLFKQIFLKTF